MTQVPGGITASQTIGPFPHEGMRWAFEASMQDPPGAIAIRGQVLDGDGNPVNDAVIEAWTPAVANREQARALPAFRRVASGEQGEFRLALTPPEGGTRGAPLAYVCVFARGLLCHVFTAVHLPDDPALADAPLLAQVPEDRRDTLVAQRGSDGAYRWDVHLQGPRETVFLDFE